MTKLNQLGKLRRFGLAGTVSLVGHGLNYYAQKRVLRRRYLVRRIHNYRLRLDLYDAGLSKDIALLAPGFSGDEDTLAAVGDSGGRDSPALYFEVRKDGDPIDPSDWIARR